MEFIETRTEGMLKFVLSDSRKKEARGRRAVINGTYVFDEKGELVVNAKDAIKMSRILCRYYGCKLVTVSDESPSAAQLATGEGLAEPKKEAEPKKDAEPKKVGTSNQPAPAKT